MDVWFECFTYCGVTRRNYELATGEVMPMEYDGNEEQAQQAASIVGRLVGCKVHADRIMYGNVKPRMEASTSKYMVAKEGCAAFPDEKSRKYIPTGFKHVFFIRDPYRVFSSFRKAMYDHQVSVGLRKGDAIDEKAFDLEKDNAIVPSSELFIDIHDVWKYVRDNVDPNPIVINSDDLLANPAEMLSKFCHLTGLPYSDSLLQWDASPDITKTWEVASDEVLEKAVPFYGTALYSSKFQPPKPPVCKDRVAPDVRKLSEASMPYFEEMNKFKI
eukprot:XP_003727732.2 PREDICTED: uncharacterized protein LOC100890490 [Strongylocentrotus purpuratus]